MGGAIPFIVFVVIALVVLYFLSTSGVVALSKRRAGDTAVAEEMPAGVTLQYAVPLGQDPSTVVAALTRHGYDAALDASATDGEHQVVEVARPDRQAPDREDVRRVIREEATLNFEGDPATTGAVRFLDER